MNPNTELDLIEDEGYRALIGDLVINHAAAVHALQRFAWIIIDATDRRAAQIILGNPSRLQLTDLVEKLLPHRTSDRAILQKAKGILNQLDAVTKTRNDIVHAASLVQMKRGAESPRDANWITVLGTALVKGPNRRQDGYRAVPSRAEIERDAMLARKISGELQILESLYMDWMIQQREVSAEDEPFLPRGDK
jgi:hypothetical protein